jgi:hypothetical protein
MTIVRWILAVIAGVVLYWVVMLLSLGVIGMIVQNTQTISQDRAGTIVGHSAPLVGLALGLGSFAAALVAIAIAPRTQRRAMGALAVVAAAAWAVYGQVFAGHDTTTAVIEAGGAIVGAIAAYGLAQAMFRRRAGS